MSRIGPSSYFERPIGIRFRPQQLRSTRVSGSRLRFTQVIARHALPSRVRRVCQWWTGGKDTSWALRLLRSDPAWDVCGLVTQIDRHTGREVIHGPRKELLEQQAAAVDLPLHTIEIDENGPSSEYEAALNAGLSALRREGADFVAFGELSSGAYLDRRLGHLARAGLTAEFPLWGRDPRKHVEELLEAQVSAWVCAVNTIVLGADQAGRRFDADFIVGLPPHVSPGGDGGEFHTFVEWAPGWSGRVPVKPAQLIERYGFAFVDLESAPSDASDTSSPKALTLPGASHVTRSPREIDPFQYYQRLRRVQEYVDENLGEELRLGTVARVAAMRASSFGRFFRQRVDMPFSAWLTIRRVQRACHLLRESNMPIERVGRMVGFGGERTFRRAFRLHVGCSASEFRRSHLEDEARRELGP